MISVVITGYSHISFVAAVCRLSKGQTTHLKMWTLTILALVLLTSSGSWAQCTPGGNCQAPDCRCWNDPSPPGGLQPSEIPQMVLVSFEYGVNRGNVDVYKNLFNGITNPNGCQPKGTFFVSKTNSDFSVVKELFDDGHEFGVTSADGTIPQDAEEWSDSYAEVETELTKAGIPKDKIKGSRGADLFMGGDDQFESLEANDLDYDSTCVSVEYVSKDNIIWPYTYDFVDSTPQCTIGTTPDQEHPGKWQFLVADLEFNGQQCASPSGCTPFLRDSQDAFDLLYDAFAKHYEGPTRAPFILYLDPMWLTVVFQNQGTRQFLQFVRAAFDDTWILTNEQALAWIKDPVPAANATSFQPWSCP